MSDLQSQLAQMTKMLKALDTWLVKAEEHAKAKSFDPAVLLQSRLAPDMFPLRRQVQSVCDGVKFLAARATGKDAPKHEDGEQSWAELRTRIADVLAFVGGFGAADFQGAEARVVPLQFMPGKGMLASDWARELNVPNTYFHVCMTYAILRHNGVNLGKMDFLASLTLRDL